MLPSEEAARRLGVKVTTLYAYVSRGLLASHPEPGGRRSLFDLADIERLANRRRGGRQVESRLATITTGVTQLREDGPCYRGRPATELARRMTFEQVAALLWQADATRGRPTGPHPISGTARSSRRPTGCAGRSSCAGPRDPLRADLRPAGDHPVGPPGHRRVDRRGRRDPAPPASDRPRTDRRCAWPRRLAGERHGPPRRPPP